MCQYALGLNVALPYTFKIDVTVHDWFNALPKPEKSTGLNILLKVAYHVIFECKLMN